MKAIRLLIAAVFLLSVSETLAQKNILFIAVDDLKPDLGCYGDQLVLSPNIDKLAGKSTLFTSAYAQQAVCGPSRASILTGLRPDRTQVWDLRTKLRNKIPDVVSLPQYFRANGYETIGMGKVFDPSSVDRKLDEPSWSQPFQKDFTLTEGFEDIAYGIYQNPKIKAEALAAGQNGKDEGSFFGKNKIQGISRLSTESLDVPDDAYMDGAMAQEAIRQLKDLGKSDKPFFLALGFKKPHLPFVAPKKYWDLYKREEMPLAEFQEKAEDSPEYAYHNAGELRSYSTDIKSVEPQSKLLKLSEDKQRELIHGYYACVSYIDAQIGMVMEALKKEGLDKNTIIVLWGDHGWHLGDHSLWCKHSNFEQATRVPLIIHSPDQTEGNQYDYPVELVDLYPTLCEMTGLPVSVDLDGQSLVPALHDKSTPIKEFAISQYPRGTKQGAKDIMGYSLRDGRYRFTEWTEGFFETSKVYSTRHQKSLELYDLKNDPLETKNIAYSPEMTDVVKDLSNKLHQFYQRQFQKINSSGSR